MLLSFVYLLLLLLLREVSSYPVILQVDEEDKRCFRFNIPGHEDAHLVVLALPNDDEIPGDDLESWYVDQAFQVTTLKTQEEGMPYRLPGEAPSDIMEKVSKYLQEHGGNQAKLRFHVTDTPFESRPANSFRQDDVKYFLPVVVNFVARLINPRARHRGSQGENLEGYGICFYNDDKERQIHVIFDMVLTSEVVKPLGDAPAKVSETDYSKEKHLTPLERALDQSINAAHSVLREMKYMEKREQRMRQTAESINTRVRWFSYLSIGVLLAVTYIQVTYLKRYFHKKKLM